MKVLNITIIVVFSLFLVAGTATASSPGQDPLQYNYTDIVDEDEEDGIRLKGGGGLTGLKGPSMGSAADISASSTDSTPLIEEELIPIDVDYMPMVTNDEPEINTAKEHLIRTLSKEGITVDPENITILDTVSIVGGLGDFRVDLSYLDEAGNDAAGSYTFLWVEDLQSLVLNDVGESLETPAGIYKRWLEFDFDSRGDPMQQTGRTHALGIEGDLGDLLSEQHILNRQFDSEHNSLNQRIVNMSPQEIGGYPMVDYVQEVRSAGHTPEGVARGQIVASYAYNGTEVVTREDLMSVVLIENIEVDTNGDVYEKIITHFKLCEIEKTETGEEGDIILSYPLSHDIILTKTFDENGRALEKEIITEIYNEETGVYDFKKAERIRVESFDEEGNPALYIVEEYDTRDMVNSLPLALSEVENREVDIYGNILVQRVDAYVVDREVEVLKFVESKVISKRYDNPYLAAKGLTTSVTEVLVYSDPSEDPASLIEKRVISVEEYDSRGNPVFERIETFIKNEDGELVKVKSIETMNFEYDSRGDAWIKEVSVSQFDKNGEFSSGVFYRQIMEQSPELEGLLNVDITYYDQLDQATPIGRSEIIDVKMDLSGNVVAYTVGTYLRTPAGEEMAVDYKEVTNLYYDSYGEEDQIVYDDITGEVLKPVRPEGISTSIDKIISSTANHFQEILAVTEDAINSVREYVDMLEMNGLDVNADGSIDEADIELVRARHGQAASYAGFLSEDEIAALDENRDGILDASDMEITIGRIETLAGDINQVKNYLAILSDAEYDFNADGVVDAEDVDYAATMHHRGVDYQNYMDENERNLLDADGDGVINLEDGDYVTAAIREHIRIGGLGGEVTDKAVNDLAKRLRTNTEDIVVDSIQLVEGQEGVYTITLNGEGIPENIAQPQGNKYTYTVKMLTHSGNMSITLVENVEYADGSFDVYNNVFQDTGIDSWPGGVYALGTIEQYDRYENLKAEISYYSGRQIRTAIGEIDDIQGRIQKITHYEIDVWTPIATQVVKYTDIYSYEPTGYTRSIPPQIIGEELKVYRYEGEYEESLERVLERIDEKETLPPQIFEDQIIVKLNSAEDRDALLAKYDIEFVRAMYDTGLTIIVKANDPSLTVSMAEELNADSLVEYAEPNYLSIVEYEGDPVEGLQPVILDPGVERIDYVKLVQPLCIFTYSGGDPETAQIVTCEFPSNESPVYIIYENGLAKEAYSGRPNDVYVMAPTPILTFSYEYSEKGAILATIITYPDGEQERFEGAHDAADIVYDTVVIRAGEQKIIDVALEELTNEFVDIAAEYGVNLDDVTIDNSMGTKPNAGVLYALYDTDPLEGTFYTLYYVEPTTRAVVNTTYQVAIVEGEFVVNGAHTSINTPTVNRTISVNVYEDNRPVHVYIHDYDRASGVFLGLQDVTYAYDLDGTIREKTVDHYSSLHPDPNNFIKRTVTRVEQGYTLNTDYVYNDEGTLVPTLRSLSKGGIDLLGPANTLIADSFNPDESTLLNWQIFGDTVGFEFGLTEGPSLKVTVNGVTGDVSISQGGILESVESARNDIAERLGMEDIGEVHVNGFDLTDYQIISVDLGWMGWTQREIASSSISARAGDLTINMLQEVEVGGAGNSRSDLTGLINNETGEDILASAVAYIEDTYNPEEYVLQGWHAVGDDIKFAFQFPDGLPMYVKVDSREGSVVGTFYGEAQDAAIRNTREHYSEAFGVPIEEVHVDGVEWETMDYGWVNNEIVIEGVMAQITIKVGDYRLTFDSYEALTPNAPRETEITLISAIDTETGMDIIENGWETFSILEEQQSLIEERQIAVENDVTDIRQQVADIEEEIGILEAKLASLLGEGVVMAPPGVLPRPEHLVIAVTLPNLENFINDLESALEEGDVQAVMGIFDNPNLGVSIENPGNIPESLEQLLLSMDWPLNDAMLELANADRDKKILDSYYAEIMLERAGDATIMLEEQRGIANVLISDLSSLEEQINAALAEADAIVAELLARGIDPAVIELELPPAIEYVIDPAYIERPTTAPTSSPPTGLPPTGPIDPGTPPPMDEIQMVILPIVEIETIEDFLVKLQEAIEAEDIEAIEMLFANEQIGLDLSDPSSVPQNITKFVDMCRDKLAMAGGMLEIYDTHRDNLVLLGKGADAMQMLNREYISIQHRKSFVDQEASDIRDDVSAIEGEISALMGKLGSAGLTSMDILQAGIEAPPVNNVFMGLPDISLEELASLISDLNTALDAGDVQGIMTVLNSETLGLDIENPGEIPLSISDLRGYIDDPLEVATLELTRTEDYRDALKALYAQTMLEKAGDADVMLKEQSDNAQALQDEIDEVLSKITAERQMAEDIVNQLSALGIGGRHLPEREKPRVVKPIYKVVTDELETDVFGEKMLITPPSIEQINVLRQELREAISLGDVQAIEGLFEANQSLIDLLDPSRVSTSLQQLISNLETDLAFRRDVNLQNYVDYRSALESFSASILTAADHLREVYNPETLRYSDQSITSGGAIKVRFTLTDGSMVWVEVSPDTGEVTRSLFGDVFDEAALASRMDTAERMGIPVEDVHIDGIARSAGSIVFVDNEPVITEIKTQITMKAGEFTLIFDNSEVLEYDRGIATERETENVLTSLVNASGVDLLKIANDATAKSMGLIDFGPQEIDIIAPDEKPLDDSSGVSRPIELPIEPIKFSRVEYGLINWQMEGGMVTFTFFHKIFGEKEVVVDSEGSVISIVRGFDVEVIEGVLMPEGPVTDDHIHNVTHRVGGVAIDDVHGIFDGIPEGSIVKILGTEPSNYSLLDSGGMQVVNGVIPVAIEVDGRIITKGPAQFKRDPELENAVVAATNELLSDTLLYFGVVFKMAPEIEVLSTKAITDKDGNITGYDVILASDSGGGEFHFLVDSLGEKVEFIQRVDYTITTIVDTQESLAAKEDLVERLGIDPGDITDSGVNFGGSGSTEDDPPSVIWQEFEIGIVYDGRVYLYHGATHHSLTVREISQYATSVTIEWMGSAPAEYDEKGNLIIDMSKIDIPAQGDLVYTDLGWLGSTLTGGSGGQIQELAGSTLTVGSGGQVILTDGTVMDAPPLTIGDLPAGSTLTVGSGGQIQELAGSTLTVGSGGQVILADGTVMDAPPLTIGDLPAGSTLTVGSGGQVIPSGGYKIIMNYDNVGEEANLIDVQKVEDLEYDADGKLLVQIVDTYQGYDPDTGELSGMIDRKRIENLEFGYSGNVIVRDIATYGFNEVTGDLVFVEKKHEEILKMDSEGRPVLTRVTSYDWAGEVTLVVATRILEYDEETGKVLHQEIATFSDANMNTPISYKVENPPQISIPTPKQVVYTFDGTGDIIGMKTITSLYQAAAIHAAEGYIQENLDIGEYTLLSYENVGGEQNESLVTYGFGTGSTLTISVYPPADDASAYDVAVSTLEMGEGDVLNVPGDLYVRGSDIEMGVQGEGGIVIQQDVIEESTVIIGGEIRIPLDTPELGEEGMVDVEIIETGETIEGSVVYDEISGEVISEVIYTEEPEVGIYVKEGESIQAAIDAVNEGDTIYVASGTYDENLVVNKNNIAIIGDDGVNVIGSGSQPTINVVNSSGVEIVGFNAVSGGTGYGIYLNGVSDSVLRNSRGEGALYGIISSDGNQVVIEGCEAAGTRSDFFMHTGSNYTLTDNVATGSGGLHGFWIDSRTQNVVLIDNQANGSYTSGAFAPGSDANVFSGNTINGVDYIGNVNNLAEALAVEHLLATMAGVDIPADNLIIESEAWGDGGYAINVLYINQDTSSELIEVTGEYFINVDGSSVTIAGATEDVSGNSPDVGMYHMRYEDMGDHVAQNLHVELPDGDAISVDYGSNADMTTRVFYHPASGGSELVSEVAGFEGDLFDPATAVAQFASVPGGEIPEEMLALIEEQVKDSFASGWGDPNLDPSLVEISVEPDGDNKYKARLYYVDEMMGEVSGTYWVEEVVEDQFEIKKSEINGPNYVLGDLIDEEISYVMYYTGEEGETEISGTVFFPGEPFMLRVNYEGGGTGIASTIIDDTTSGYFASYAGYFASPMAMIEDAFSSEATGLAEKTSAMSEAAVVSAENYIESLGITEFDLTQGINRINEDGNMQSNFKYTALGGDGTSVVLEVSLDCPAIENVEQASAIINEVEVMVAQADSAFLDTLSFPEGDVVLDEGTWTSGDPYVSVTYSVPATEIPPEDLLEGEAAMLDEQPESFSAIPGGIDPSELDSLKEMEAKQAETAVEDTAPMVDDVGLQRVDGEQEQPQAPVQ